MNGWSDILDAAETLHAMRLWRARKVTPIRLGAISHRREMDAARYRRWRRKNKAKALVRDALRRQQRAHLYRKGGEYYERRKSDPVNKLRQAARQRARRANERMAAG